MNTNYPTTPVCERYTKKRVGGEVGGGVVDLALAE